jgi:MFS family permease
VTTLQHAGWRARLATWRHQLARLLPADDLLRNRAYRRMFSSILVGSFGMQMTALALPLTAAVLLNATPTQMGLLAALEVLPFALLSLPTGVVLDRVRKLPVYVLGEATLAIAVISVTLAWWFDVLSMPGLYAVGFVLGLVNTVAGSASQIVLTQIVPRERLVEAYAKNALAHSASEIMAPALAGALIKLVTAPVTLAINGVLLAASTLVLTGLRVAEPPLRREPFVAALRAGLHFVFTHPLLLTLATLVGVWHVCYFAAFAVQILYATRELGMSEATVGLSYMMVGAGTVVASMLGPKVSQRLGPGPTMTLGFGLSGLGWLLAVAAPKGPLGVAGFAAMLACFGAGAIFIFINFIAIRQAVTPTHLLGRMTSTMRWLILTPAVPGALLGGWLGETLGLRSALLLAGIGGMTLAAVAWRLPKIRAIRELPVYREPATTQEGAHQDAQQDAQ